MDKRDALAAKVEELRSEIEALADADELTDEQEARLDAALPEFSEAREALDKYDARMAAVAEARAAEIPEARVSGDGAKGAPNVHIRRNVHDLGELRTASVSDLHERAERFIGESRGFVADEHREAAQKQLRDDIDGSKARHMLVFGSDEYRQGFNEYLRNPQLGIPESMRTALSTTAANGGVMVPTPIDPTVILTNAGAANPIRQLATVKTIANTTWKGVTSAGVTAEWIAEATQVADASPTFAQPTITPAKADAYIQASLEIVADSAVTGELGMLIADAKDRLEATAFWTGTGSGQPKGVVTAVSGGSYTVTGTSGAVGAADLTAADIYALDDNLSYRYKANASFVAHRAIYNKVRQLGTSNTYHAFWASFGGGIPPQLIGYNAYEASAMDSTIVSGSTDFAIVLGDFRQGYYVVDRMGLELMYNPLVVGANARPTGEVGWVAFWRTGGDCVNSSAFRMLHL